MFRDAGADGDGHRHQGRSRRLRHRPHRDDLSTTHPHRREFDRRVGLGDKHTRRAGEQCGREFPRGPERGRPRRFRGLGGAQPHGAVPLDGRRCAKALARLGRCQRGLPVVVVGAAGGDHGARLRRGQGRHREPHAQPRGEVGAARHPGQCGRARRDRHADDRARPDGAGDHRRRTRPNPAGPLGHTSRDRGDYRVLCARSRVPTPAVALFVVDGASTSQ